MDDEDNSGWLERVSRNGSGKTGTKAKKNAKEVNNYEAAHMIPRRGLPPMATDDPEWAMKNIHAHSCILCGSEAAPIIVPVYAKAGNFFTVVCGNCKGRRYWFRYAASMCLNEMTRRDCVARLRRRRAQWLNVLEKDENQ